MRQSAALHTPLARKKHKTNKLSSFLPATETAVESTKMTVTTNNVKHFLMFTYINHVRRRRRRNFILPNKYTRNNGSLQEKGFRPSKLATYCRTQKNTKYVQKCAEKNKWRIDYSKLTIVKCPHSQAMCSGVVPSNEGSLTLDPRSIRQFTMSICPPSAARCRGLRPTKQHNKELVTLRFCRWVTTSRPGHLISWTAVTQRKEVTTEAWRYRMQSHIYCIK